MSLAFKLLAKNLLACSWVFGLWVASALTATNINADTLPSTWSVSTAVLAEHRAAIESAPDFAAFIAQQSARFTAHALDPKKRVARALMARSIAAAFEQCLVFQGPLNRKDFFSAFSRSIKFNDPMAPARIVLTHGLYNRCEALLVSKQDFAEQRVQWLQQAAQLGDIAAKIALRQVATPTTEQIPAFRAELAQALDSQDPDAIWEAGRALNWAGLSWIDLTGGGFPVSDNGKTIDGLQAVFQLAACEMGRACQRDSLLMKNFCVRGTCQFDSYTDWLPSFMNKAQVAAVQQQLPKVLSAVRKKSAAKLLRLRP